MLCCLKAESHPTSTYLAIGRRLRRSTTAEHDAVVRFKATVCEGEQNAYPCKPTCLRYSECIIVWEAVNRLRWTDNVTASWILSKKNWVKLNLQLFKHKPFSKYTKRILQWHKHTFPCVLSRAIFPATGWMSVESRENHKRFTNQSEKSYGLCTCTYEAEPFFL